MPVTEPQRMVEIAPFPPELPGTQTSGFRILRSRTTQRKQGAGVSPRERASSGGGGIEPVAQMVAEEIERHHRKENVDARNQDPRVAREVLHVLRLREQVSPAGGRLLDSQTEQRERAFAEDENTTLE